MTTEERFDRIETIIERVVDRQEQQDETLAILTESQIKLTESQTKLTSSVEKLSESVDKTQMQVQALSHAVEQLSREWQAYLTTIRPQ